MKTIDLLKRVSSSIGLEGNMIWDKDGKRIVFIGREDELRHFLNFLYLSGIKVNAIDDELRRMKNAFSMIVSIITYGKSDITIEEIVNDK